MRNSQSGFTLLEVMTVVVLVGGLAALALPSIQSSTRDMKHEVEVSAMFGEMRARQEQFKVIHGSYASTGSGENDQFPRVPSAGAPAPYGTLPPAWEGLGMQPPFREIACSYVAVAGRATEPAGSLASSFGYQPPCRPWYYLVARCKGADNTDHYYFAADDDATVRELGDSRYTPTATANAGCTAQQDVVAMIEGPITPDGQIRTSSSSTSSSSSPPPSTSSTSSTSTGTGTMPTGTGSYWGSTTTSTSTSTTSSGSTSSTTRSTSTWAQWLASFGWRR